jgi:Lrp/AsnC family transcriptional regulator, leucine-responsive regulatory protein
MLRVLTAPTMPHMEMARKLPDNEDPRPSAKELDCNLFTIPDFLNQHLNQIHISCNSQACVHNHFSMAALDDTDLRLLDLLQDNAGLSNQDLAAAAHVSPATALRRLRRLTEEGVIERRIALLSSEKLGTGLQVLVEVQLDRQGAEHLDAFEALAVADPAVQQCWRVSPGPDFLLVLWVADMAAYHTLVQRLFTQHANVRNVKSFFAVKRAKFAPRIDLHSLKPSSTPPGP